MLNVRLIVLVSHWYPLSVVFNELDKVKSAQIIKLKSSENHTVALHSFLTCSLAHLRFSHKILRLNHKGRKLLPIYII